MKLFEGFKVKGKPFFPLGAQSHNSSTYTPLMFSESVKAALALNCNTVEAPVYWEIVEKNEGFFDFSCVDFMVKMCREAGLKLVVLWFASWKNGDMSYTPEWVKSDQSRFQRVLRSDGTPVTCLSAHYEANRIADSKAFNALIAHIKKIDQNEGTVIAVQIENEPGFFKTDRDFSPKALENLEKNVPSKFLDYLEGKKNVPAYKFWQENGLKKNASWFDSFGFHGYEFCEAWHLALYIDEIAAAAKQVYDIPMYVNVWLIAPQNWGVPGMEYPGGGAVERTLHVWLAASDHLDLIAPDIYEANCYRYEHIVDFYGTGENALFVPEAALDPVGACNIFNAIARGTAGYAFFGSESCFAASDKSTDNRDLTENALPVRDSNLAVKNAMSLILKHGKDCRLNLPEPNQKGKIFPVVPHTGQNDQGYEFEKFLGRVNFNNAGRHDYSSRRMKMTEGQLMPRGLIFEDEPYLFYLAGMFNLQLVPKKSPNVSMIANAPFIADFLSVEEGLFDENGNFVASRKRNGDEVFFGGFWVTPDCGIVRVRLVPSSLSVPSVLLAPLT